MILTAYGNADFARVHREDVAECHGRLGAFYAEMNVFQEAEKHLSHQVEILQGIDCYDLPHATAMQTRLHCAYKDLGDFYVKKNDYCKAIGVWVKILRTPVAFTLPIDGYAILDSIAVDAGWIDMMVDCRVLYLTLERICFAFWDYAQVEVIKKEDMRVVFESFQGLVKQVAELMPVGSDLYRAFIAYWELCLGECRSEKEYKTKVETLRGLIEKCKRIDDKQSKWIGCSLEGMLVLTQVITQGVEELAEL
ncbi:MAG: hypothetical protein FWD76_03245 [Firmicutes bacterium]|nr:hypothetical protein [Bacillota bacterium]